MGRSHNQYYYFSINRHIEFVVVASETESMRSCKDRPLNGPTQLILFLSCFILVGSSSAHEILFWLSKGREKSKSRDDGGAKMVPRDIRMLIHKETSAATSVPPSLSTTKSFSAPFFSSLFSLRAALPQSNQTPSVAWPVIHTPTPCPSVSGSTEEL